MNTKELFIITLAAIFTLPYLIWRLGKTDYFAPLVVVQLIIGILMGPGVLGAIFPDYYHFVFNQQLIQALNGISWWGVMIFVWIAGIELDLEKTWIHRRESFITAGLALALPVLFGGVIAIGLLMNDGWIGAKAMPWQFVLAIGMACAVASLPILMLFMDKLEILRHPIGQRILRYGSLDDIATWGVLALILTDWQRAEKQAIFLIGFAAIGYGFRKLFVRLPETDRWYVSLIWLTSCSFLADLSGFHFMVGAFLSGVIIDNHWFDQKQMDFLRHHVLLLLMPVFFLITGLKTNWAMGGVTVFIVASALLVTSVVGKLMGVHIASKIFGWDPKESLFIGWLLQTKGLITIVFVSILLDEGIITGETFTALLLMAVGSTMLTMPMVLSKFNIMKSTQSSKQ